MNAFFASVEQQSNPYLKDKPIVICGRGRTVVATASYQARKYGVKTGMSLYEAKNCCPHVIPVEGNHRKYTDTAKRIHRICLKYTDKVEVFSIDEVFMDVSSCTHLFGSPLRIACQIKKEIKEQMGLTCSIGIAPTKLLAKLASEREKPDGLVLFKPSDIPNILSQTPVQDLCGIGDKTKSALNRLGIETAEDLGKADIRTLVRHFGFMGNILKRMGRGEDITKVSCYSDEFPVKSIGHSNTLPKDTFDMEVIKSFLLILSERAGQRLREHKMKGRTVSVHIRYSDFKGQSRQKSLSGYINTGKDIYQTACSILKSFLPFKDKIRLIGVRISNFVIDPEQKSLFADFEKQEKMERAADKINKKYGEFVLRPLSSEIAREFTGNSIDIPARVHGFQFEI